MQLLKIELSIIFVLLCVALCYSYGDGNWCSWTSWSSRCPSRCNTDLNKNRTRLCACPKPTGTGKHCNATGSVAFEVKQCCTATSTFFSGYNMYMIIGFGIAVVISIVIAVVRLCFWGHVIRNRNMDTTHAPPMAAAAALPQSNPALAPSSLNAANASYPRQATYQDQGQMNMGFAPTYPFAEASQPAGAPPPYDESFKHQLASAPPADSQ